MPVITLEGPYIADMEKKRLLVEKITRSAAEAYDLPEDKMIVLLKENNPANVAVGGTLLLDRQ